MGHSSARAALLYQHASVERDDVESLGRSESTQEHADAGLRAAETDGG